MILNRQLFHSTDRRTNIIKENAVYSLFIKGANMLVSLLLVPLTIDYVNPELYGIWLALSSMVTWLGFFDMGFGLGLRNKLTMAVSLGNYKYGKVLISSTYAILTVIFFLVCIVAYFSCSLVDWPHVLNVSSDYSEVINDSFHVLIIAFCARMVFQVVTNVCQSYQMTALAGFLDMLGNLLSLIYIYTLTITIAPNLVYVTGVFCLMPIMVFVLANIFLYRTHFKAVAPSVRYIRLSVFRDITSLGAQFFLIQIVCVILYQATNIIISHYCGPEDVTVYNIAYKYLNISLMIFSILQSPIWSAFGDAYAKKDYEWMQAIYRKIVRLLGITLIFIVVMVLVSPVAYEVWIGNSVKVPFRITVLLSIYTIAQLICNVHTMIINGIGKLRLELVLAYVQGLVYPLLIYFFAPSLQLEGILVSLIIIALIPNFFIVRQAILLVNNQSYGIYNK